MKNKLLWIIIPIITFAASLGITYAVITANRTPHATPDEAATADSAVPTVSVSNDEPTSEPTDPPTEPPTELDYTDAYRAYLKVLEDNKDIIKDYDWQFSINQMQKSDIESRPVVFADIAGDETPEMIVVCCDPDDSYRSSAYLRIYRYLDGSAQRVYAQTRDNELPWMDFTGSKGLGYPGGSQYVLYQLPGEKTLYHYDCGGMGLSSFEMVRSYADSEDGIKMNTEAYYVDYQQNAGTDTYQVDSTEVSKSACLEKISELTGSSINVLMRNTIGTNENTASSLAYQYDNQAMTYEEAIAFLNEKTGKDPSKSTDSPDFSVIEGEYHYLKEFGSDESDITIGKDGSFYHRSYNFTGASIYDSVCHGTVINVEQDKNIRTKYTFKIADQKLEHSVGDTGTRTQGSREVTYKYTDYALFNEKKKFAFYLPGTSVSDLTVDEYEFFKRFENTEAPDGYIHSALLSVYDNEGNGAYLYRLNSR